MAYESQEVITRESPDIEAYKLGLMEQAKQLASAPPVGGMPEFEVAGMDQAQIDAYNKIVGGSGYEDTLQKGIGSLSEAEEAYKASRGEFDPNKISDFMNPYSGDVIDVYTKEALKQNAMLQNQLGLGSSSAGAFGGGRQNIVSAQIAGDVADRTSKATSDLLYKGYGDASKLALGAFEGARGRDLAAGQAFAGLGGQYGGIAGLEQDLLFKDAGAMYDMGAKKQAQSQIELDAERKTAMQNIMEPYQRLSYLGDIYQGMPSSQNVYSTSYGSDPGLFNQLIGGATAGAGIYGAFGGFGRG
tara:strand:+ start:814 stop:1716 length:903 start_codon:yes stop_codon:yes gene_type:complete